METMEMVSRGGRRGVGIAGRQTLAAEPRAWEAHAAGGRAAANVSARAGYLGRAYALLAQAGAAATPEERLSTAYLAALKAVAALGAVRGTPPRLAGKSAWVILPRVAPELGHWAEIIGGYSRLRARIEAGGMVNCSWDSSNRCYREVSEFLEQVHGLCDPGSLAA